MATLPYPPPLPILSKRLDATPVSTNPTSALTPSPAATTPSSTPASRPLHALTSGRSKALRWCRDTPPSGKSGGDYPLSFKEALLAASPVAPTSSPSVSLANPPEYAFPRILLR
ncbi:unnamed protein product [Urochloa humidicola]